MIDPRKRYRINSIKYSPIEVIILDLGDAHDLIKCRPASSSQARHFYISESQLVEIQEERDEC